MANEGEEDAATYKRKAVEQRARDLIEPMYGKNFSQQRQGPDCQWDSASEGPRTTCVT